MRAIAFFMVVPLAACGGGGSDEPFSLWRVLAVIAVGILVAAWRARR
jgi:hypothetical protein